MERFDTARTVDARKEEIVQKDKSEKILEDYNDVFADIYNILVFNKRYLDEDRLETGATESIYKAEKGDLKEQRRDVLKTYHEQNFVICSLGIENQSTIDKYLPLRVMGYDYATYQRQMRNEKKITPTITIVLNFSEKRWNKPTNLHGLFKLPNGLKHLVQDYQIKVYDIAFLEDDVIEKFTSDFKVVAKYLKNRRLRKLHLVVEDQQEIHHVEAVLDLFRVFTQDERYDKLLTEKIKDEKQKGEKVNMCYVVDAFEQRGIERGRLGLLKKWVEKGKVTLEEAAEEMEVTVAEIEEMFANKI